MYKTSRLFAALLFAFSLSACSTAPKEEAAPVIEPTPVVEPAAEVAPAAEAETVAEPVPAPQAAAPRPVVKKHRKKVKAQTKPVEPEPVQAPVSTPEPTPAPVVVPVQEPAAPAVVAATPKQAEAGFLEKYWIWLLGIVIAIVVVMLLVRKKD